MEKYFCSVSTSVDNGTVNEIYIYVCMYCFYLFKRLTQDEFEYTDLHFLALYSSVLQAVLVVEAAAFQFTLLYCKIANQIIGTWEST